METHSRTILKTITWRILATITALLVTYYYTKDWKLSLTVGLVMAFYKTILYYIHERVWNKISFGRKD